MHTTSFDYAILRIVPRVEREEFINAGVILLCREKRFLAALVHLDEQRLHALWPGLDAQAIREQLDATVRVCAGDHAAGPIARLSQSERFQWLTSPRSTVLQTSPVHTGICTQTESLLLRLHNELVLGVNLRKANTRT